MTDPRPVLNMKKVEAIHELALRAAARSNDPVLTEIVREVRAGRSTLRDAAASSAYHDTFAQGAARTLQTLRDVGPVELDETTAEQRLDNLVESLTEWDEQAGTATVAEQARVGTTDDEYFDDKSFMVAGPGAERTGAAPQRDRWQRRWQ